jgi:hypothetical protein
MIPSSVNIDIIIASRLKTETVAAVPLLRFTRTLSGFKGEVFIVLSSFVINDDLEDRVATEKVKFHLGSIVEEVQQFHLEASDPFYG